jgi:hypothetical protein
MCRYFERNTCKYLLLYVSLSCCIFKEIPLDTAPFSAPFSAPISAPVSAHRHLRGRVAVASLLHRRRIAVTSPDRIAAASRRGRVADFIRITFASGASDELHAD